MSTNTTAGDGVAVLDQLKPPEGVVLPPREIRNILEKTAGFVARNGGAFEERVRDKERQNPKFSFLSPEDAYNPFYRWRLAEIREGRGTAIAAGRANEGNGTGPGGAGAAKGKGPPKPPDFGFSARMPRISQRDLDVVRLTALFVAKNGRGFMTHIAQREAGKPQFQFLMPNHTFHNFFQHLVDQYTTLLRAGGLDGEGSRLQEERVAALQQNVDNKYGVLPRARQRSEYAKFMDSERVKKDEDEEKKKEEFARIDWNDFVVVEAIVFTDADEHAVLPPPTSLSELQYASLEDRKQVSISSNMRIEEALPTDEDFAAFAAPAAAPAQAPAPSPAPGQPLSYPLPVHTTTFAPQNQPYQLPASQASPQPQPPGQSALADDEERRIQERTEARARVQQAQAEARGGSGPMRIRDNYVPRAAQRAANKQQAGQSVMCPNCKQMIPVDEMEEHMRIELLDPNWKDQKSKADARNATTNLSTVDVANNLKRLASQRSDVFDELTGQPLSEDELHRRKKTAIATQQPEREGSGTPGQQQNPFGGPVQAVNVEEQIKMIHQKFAERR